jgi:hypothetical protein
VEQKQIYLASRFARRDEMRAIALDLERAGFAVTSRWLESPASLTSDDLDPEGLGGRLAVMDFEDLKVADLCIAFTEEEEQTSRGRGGRHTELGMAIGLGKEVMIVGPREHVFHALPTIRQFPNWEAARESLERDAQDSSRLIAI